jgi:hypothetical protein
MTSFSLEMLLEKYMISSGGILLIGKILKNLKVSKLYFRTIQYLCPNLMMEQLLAHWQ